MTKADKYFLNNLQKILKEGQKDINPRPRYKDGSPAHSIFITHVFETYDISKGEFPITTLRPTAIKTGVKEILWIYQKSSNSLEEARSMGVDWWDNWDVGDGTIGKRYGHTIKEYDLMSKLLRGLKTDPFCRRHIIDMWQEVDLSSPGLAPCAYSTTWSVTSDGKLDLLLNQRSQDYIMAGYINKIQYVALQMMVAKHCGLLPGKFSHMVANLHVYDRHLEALQELLSKKPSSVEPKLMFNPDTDDFWSFKVLDFSHNLNTIKIPALESPLEIAI